MSKYFYHGTLEIDTLIKILLSGSIKSRRLLNYDIPGYFNTEDYVSLCRKIDDLTYYDEYRNSFESFIENNFCLIISNEVNAIKTEYYDSSKTILWTEIVNFLHEHEDVRYSDLIDEWQVKDEISLKYIIGIGLPFTKINMECLKDNSLFDKVIIVLLIARCLGLKVINTEEDNFIEKFEKCNNEVLLGKSLVYKGGLSE